MGRFVIGVTGASGLILAYRAVKALIESEHDVELVFTQNAAYAASLEMEVKLNSAMRWVESFDEKMQKKITIHPIKDVGSTIGSGSFPTDGMVVIPCSMSTLAAIALGLADNCLRRAADVMLKERRPLIIVPRESPLNEIHLEHMLKLTRMGAIIVPPVPAWYNFPKSIEDVENFIVGKALDALKVPNQLYIRWKC